MTKWSQMGEQMVVMGGQGSRKQSGQVKFNLIRR